ncbi:MAG: MBL fold metallo-hydrolase, partial [Bacteroidetes bacterium]
VPGRHFSGRSLARGKTLWSAFVLNSGDYNLFLGGDSGYDSHFQLIGEKFGPFDIAMLECGQYNQSWPHIHMMPEETAKAAIELKAKWLLPVHWAKFSLALHPWDEPIKRVSDEAKRLSMEITTPRIGELVILGGNYPVTKWWLEVK